ncbi:T9SS type A sorting domain-containing protein [Marinilabiliaceae bacterium AAT]|uniref:T9SS type A sorting domain-containing protein n=2 Tax=Plebeiibacterium sediminum TaxID=2992112 RepID=A0AAE3SHM2_9BACT|nr:T9SS type A sorting domain-containing protein [Plebeiobacterium sediminum]
MAFLCLNVISAQETLEVPVTFNGNTDTDWSKSSNWEVDYYSSDYDLQFSSWSNPKVPYWTVTSGTTDVNCYVSAIITNGVTCDLIDSDNSFDFYETAAYYQRMYNLTVEESATLNFTYGTDLSSEEPTPFYITKYFTVNGTLNLNRGKIDCRTYTYITNGTITVNDGTVLNSKNFTFLGDFYEAATASTDEVNSVGRLIVNGGTVYPGSYGFRFRNHYTGNTEPALEINDGIVRGTINDLLNTEGKGYAVTKPGQIEINSTGEFQLSGYLIDDLWFPLYDGIFTSNNGTKLSVTNKDDATVQELALMNGLTITEVDEDEDDVTDYLSIKANDPVPTAIETIISKKKEINIYPNPSSNGVFYLDGQNFTSPVNATVYSTSGNIVFNKKYKTSSVITINTKLSKGIYILEINTNDQIYTKKILIK